MTRSRQLLLTTLGCAAALTAGRPVIAITATPQAPNALGEPAGASFFGLTPQFAVSPNGHTVVFVAVSANGPAKLWLQATTGGAARELAGTDQASYPFWSADSQRVGFFASGVLKTIGVNANDRPANVCPAPTGRGGTWNAEGTIVFSSGITDPLRKVAAQGGVPTPITVVNSARENSHRWPSFLPDNRHVLFWAGAGSAPPELRIASLDSPDVVSVTPSDSNATYAGGYVFFGQKNALMALAFDPVTLKPKGDAIRVVEPLSGDAGSSFASFSAAADGTLLYTRGAARQLLMTWFDRHGKASGTLGAAGQYTNVALSPDNKQAVLSLSAGTPPNRDVWSMNLTTGALTRLTTDPAVDASPVWSQDGKSVVFSSQRAGPYQMYERTLTATQDQLLLKSDVATIATDYARTGQLVAYTRGTAGTGLSVWLLPLAPGSPPRPFLTSKENADNAVFSPDGSALAFQSNRSGHDEIYLSAISSSGAAPDVIQVSTGGGTQPLWPGAGREIFFLAPDGSVMTRETAPDAASPSKIRLVGPPQKLFAAPLSLVIRRAYSVTSDGQRFLIPTIDTRLPQTITIAPKWSASATTGSGR